MFYFVFLFSFFFFLFLFFTTYLTTHVPSWVKMATGPPYYCPSRNISRNMTGIGEGMSRAHEGTLCGVSVNIRNAKFLFLLSKRSESSTLWECVRYTGLEKGKKNPKNLLFFRRRKACVENQKRASYISAAQIAAYHVKKNWLVVVENQQTSSSSGR